MKISCAGSSPQAQGCEAPRHGHVPGPPSRAIQAQVGTINVSVSWQNDGRKSSDFCQCRGLCFLFGTKFTGSCLLFPLLVFFLGLMGLLTLQLANPGTDPNHLLGLTDRSPLSKDASAEFGSVLLSPSTLDLLLRGSNKHVIVEFFAPW